MKRYAVLCGSAPEGFRQKKLELTYEFLTGAEGASGADSGANIIVFPNGISELSLEAVLNDALDNAASEDDGEVLLYFYAASEADLNALSEYEAVGYGRLPVVRLCGEEIRRDVIAYYMDLAEQTGVRLIVEYGQDGEFLKEEELGWERVGSV